MEEDSWIPFPKSIVALIVIPLLFFLLFFGAEYSYSYELISFSNISFYFYIFFILLTLALIITCLLGFFKRNRNLDDSIVAGTLLSMVVPIIGTFLFTYNSKWTEFSWRTIFYWNEFFTGIGYSFLFSLPFLVFWTFILYEKARNWKSITLLGNYYFFQLVSIIILFGLRNSSVGPEGLILIPIFVIWEAILIAFVVYQMNSFYKSNPKSPEEKEQINQRIEQKSKSFFTSTFFKIILSFIAVYYAFGMADDLFLYFTASLSISFLEAITGIGALLGLVVALFFIWKKIPSKQ